MPGSLRSHHSSWRQPRRLWLSLAFTFAAALPVALFFNGSVRQSVHLSRLDGPPAQRERALNYVMRESPTDHALARAVVDRFDTLSPEAVLQAYAALARANRARDADAVARLIHTLHRFDHAAFTRAFALLDAAGAGRDPMLLDQAGRRIARAAPREADELQRLMAAQGAWTTPPVPAAVYLDWIAQRCADSQPALRRQAAGLIATLPAPLFNTADSAARARELLAGLAADPQPSVRRAALAAAAALHALDPMAAKIAHHLQTDGDPAVRAAAADVVDLLAGRPVPEPALPRPLKPHEPVTDVNRLAVWRDLLLSPEMPAGRRQCERMAAAAVGDDQPDTPLAYAAAARRGVVDDALLAKAHDAPGLPEAEWRRLLAQLEGAALGTVTIDLPADTPYLLRPAAARAALRPQADWLRPVLRLDDRPALRADACLVAAQRLNDEIIDQLIHQLLNDPDTESRISAAMIAGLRGRRVEALYRQAHDDPSPEVRRFAQLARWMQHDLPELDGHVAQWLGRPGLPEPLVMLALLHRGEWGVVLDRLFDPAAYSPQQRRALLGGERFAVVLDQHLPPDAPRLNLWADGDHFARELDALAAWAAVHRRRGDGFGSPTGQHLASNFK